MKELKSVEIAEKLINIVLNYDLTSDQRIEITELALRTSPKLKVITDAIRDADRKGVRLTKDSFKIYMSDNHIMAEDFANYDVMYTSIKMDSVELDELPYLRGSIKEHQLKAEALNMIKAYKDTSDVKGFISAIASLEIKEKVKPTIEQLDRESALTEKLPLNSIIDTLPQEMQDFFYILRDSSPITPPSIQLGATLATFGAVVSKNATIENLDRRYYPNLWIVGLASTNANKSGVTNSIEKAISHAQKLCSVYRTKEPFYTVSKSFTIASLFREFNGEIKGKEYSEASPAEKEEIKRGVIAKQEEYNGRYLISDEFSYNLMDIMSSGVNGSSKTSEILALADGDGSSITSATKGDGYRIIADGCFSCLGLTQRETWGELIASTPQYEDSGIMGRMIVLNDEYYQYTKDKHVGPYDSLTERTEALGDILLKAYKFLGSNAKFNYKVDKDCEQVIKDFFTLESSHETWRILSESVGDWKSKFKGKVIIQAIKLEAICSAIEGSVSLSSERLHAFMVFCAWNILKQLLDDEDSSVKKWANKVIQLIKISKQGKISTSDVRAKRWKYNGRNIRADEVHMIFDDLESKGMIVTETIGKKRYAILKEVA